MWEMAQNQGMRRQEFREDVLADLVRPGLGPAAESAATTHTSTADASRRRSTAVLTVAQAVRLGLLSNPPKRSEQRTSSTG
jgi:hypothetical protein